jgi:hypothetical protein
METSWENIKKSISGSYQMLSKKAGKLTQIGRLKLEVIAVKRDIEKAFIELGGRVFQAFEKKQTDKILSESEILNLVELIRTRQLELENLKKKIEQVHDQRIEKAKT